MRKIFLGNISNKSMKDEDKKVVILTQKLILPNPHIII